MGLNEAYNKKYVGKTHVVQHRGLLKQVSVWDVSDFGVLI